jgi:hypothetical protein
MRPNVAMVVADVNLNMVAQARGAVTGASGVVALGVQATQYRLP